MHSKKTFPEDNTKGNNYVFIYYACIGMNTIFDTKALHP